MLTKSIVLSAKPGPKGEIGFRCEYQHTALRSDIFVRLEKKKVEYPVIGIFYFWV